MSISSINRKAGPYYGNDVSVDFPFAFKVFSTSDVVVYFTSTDRIESLLTQGTNYSISLNSDQEATPGGTVTLPTALATGTKLTLTSDVPELQPVTLTNNGGFYPRVINDALDRATIQIQQLREKLSRALVWPISSATGSLPDPVGNAVIGWNATGTSLINIVLSAGSSMVDLAQAAGSSLIGFIQSGVGAVTRTAQDKMRESVSVKDFGAVGNGIADDTAAIQAAEASMSTGSVLLFPAGTYKITSGLLSTRQRAAWVGSGSKQTVIQYSGVSTTSDIVVFGDGTNAILGCKISGIRIASSTNMTGGAGLRLRKFCRSSLTDVVLDGQDGNGYLYHGVWFDQLDNVYYDGCEIRAQQDGLRINGGVGSVPKADLLINNYKIAQCATGIRIGGAFGGLYFGQGSVAVCTNGVSIDTTLVAEANREVFFSSTMAIDASTACGVVLDQSLASQLYVNFPSGMWVASSGTHGIWIKNANGAKINVNAYIYNITGDGVRIDDANAQVAFCDPIFNSITGYGINPTVVSSTIWCNNARFIATPSSINLTNTRVVSSFPLPISIQSGRAIYWDTYSGTLDGSGNAVIAHGKGGAYYQKSISVMASAKSSGGAWMPLTPAYIDGTNISITGSAPLASRPYNVMVLVGDQNNSGW